MAPTQNVDFQINSSQKNINVVNNYQDKAVSGRGRAGRIMMSAGGGDGEGPTSFFDFEASMLSGGDPKKLGDLVKGKKAILVVNVASE